MNNVKKAHRNNLKASRSEEFVSWMVHELRENYVQVMRTHVIGDYYDAEYTNKWLQIVRRSPKIKFFSYTRSWNVPDYLDAIIELGRQKNMRMWLSFDKAMPVPPRIRGFRRCYLSTADDDQPPCSVDLVFRDDQSTVMKFTDNGSLVCPYDNGITATTCSKCQICWKLKYGPKTKRKNARTVLE